MGINQKCSDIKLTDEMKNEMSKFNSDEEFLRKGGFSIEALDRAAFGFSSEDIKTLRPNQLNIKWKDDYENVIYEQNKSGLSKIDWANKINLNEPIDVIFEKNKFFIDDGHHRFYAAKILNKPLNVNLTIKQNPIIYLNKDLSYDDFHRCAFSIFKKQTQFEESLDEQTTAYQETLTETLETLRPDVLIKKIKPIASNFLLKSIKIYDKDSKIKIVFPSYILKEKNIEKLFKFIELMNNNGWFPSFIGDISFKDFMNKFANKKNIGNVYNVYYGLNNEYFNDHLIDLIKRTESYTLEIYFEKKYDKQTDYLPKFLYHATSDLYIDKIMKYGLIPKSKNNVADYPQRIYLCQNLKDALNISDPFGGLPMFWKNKKLHPNDKIPTKIVYLKIDVSKCNNLKLYKDPNYNLGLYTYNTIPPQAITIHSEDMLDEQETLTENSNTYSYVVFDENAVNIEKQTKLGGMEISKKELIQNKKLKEDAEDVNFMGEITKGELEEAKKKKADRCLRIARKRIPKSSAYRSANIVRCRQGDIWTDLKEEEESDIQEPEYALIEITKALAFMDDKYTFQLIPKLKLNNRLIDIKKGASGTKQISKDNIKVLKTGNKKELETKLKELQNVGEKMGSRKQKQLDIINKTNPAPNDQNTWIRNIEDILSPEEAFKDDDNFIGTPDFRIKDAKEALKNGEIIVYSSYPIKNGVFVTPSKMEATLYAGNKNPYSKKVKLTDVAWIDSNEGQYAEVNAAEQSLDEKWSKKYKRSIDCNNPKGFSQKAHCKGKMKEEEITRNEQQVPKTILNKDIKIQSSEGRKGLVPISELEEFIGEDRLGKAKMPTSRATIDKLKKDIYKNGFKEPIIIFYDKFSGNGEATIIEGNHRIIAAKELGLTEVPVIFEKGTIRDNESRIKNKMFPIKRKTIGSIDDTRGVKGFDLGLTVRQPTEADFVKSAEQSLNEKTDYSKEKEQGLHGWFARQGGKGKSKGWVDCNTCRDGKCKSCGRKEGESRAKYPACRPTPSACKTKGKGKSWGKKSTNEDVLNEQSKQDIERELKLNEIKNIFKRLIK